MSDYRQDPPYSLQVELVEGCTLACDFCGINGIREKPGLFKFMKLDTAIQIASQVKALDWNPRIEFAMHGEPSLHPQLLMIVDSFRTILGPHASIVMFSNGSGFLPRPELIDELLDAGLNTLGLDAYEHVNIVPRVMRAYSELPGKNPVYFYPEDKTQNMHSGRRVGHKDVVVIQDILSAEEGNHATLNTHCGGGMKPPDGLPLKRRCAKPFRELAIRWDGNVALCCNDFRGEFKVGNIMEIGIDAVWQHPRMMAARVKLMQSDRGFKPCDKCTALSMRVGLLPDSKGKLVLNDPTQEEEMLLQEAVAGQPYTPVVLRMWEVGSGPHNLIPDRKKALMDAMKRK